MLSGGGHVGQTEALTSTAGRAGGLSLSALPHGGGHGDGNRETEREDPGAGLVNSLFQDTAWALQPSSIGSFDLISSLPTGHQKVKGFLFFYCNSLEG